MLTTKEVASQLRLSTRKVVDMVNAGEIECYKLNERTFRFKQEFVDDYLMKKFYGGK